MAIAMREPVTVSIAAETIGMSSSISSVRRERVETCVGRMSLRAGMSRTSSKVRPSFANLLNLALPSRAIPPPLRKFSGAALFRGGRSRHVARGAEPAHVVAGEEVEAVLRARGQSAGGGRGHDADAHRVVGVTGVGRHRAGEDERADGLVADRVSREAGQRVAARGPGEIDRAKAVLRLMLEVSELATVGALLSMPMPLTVADDVLPATSAEDPPALWLAPSDVSTTGEVQVATPDPPVSVQVKVTVTSPARQPFQIAAGAALPVITGETRSESPACATLSALKLEMSVRTL